MPEDEYQKSQIMFLNFCHDVLKDDGSLFYNHALRIHKNTLYHPLKWIFQSKLNLYQEIIWNRFAGPNVAPVRYVPIHEHIFWLTKLPKMPNFHRGIRFNIKDNGTIWNIRPSKRKEHPATFPQQLIEQIVGCIKDDDVKILDPYMGSGTTLFVAKKYGLHADGVELSRNYCNIAIQELENIETKKLFTQGKI